MRTCYFIFNYWNDYAVPLTALLLVLSLVFYARLRFDSCRSYGCTYDAYGLADCYFTCGGRFLYCSFVLAWIGQFYGHKVEGKSLLS